MWWLVFVLSLAGSTVVQAVSLDPGEDAKILSIQFKGLKTTRESLLLQEITIQVGDSIHSGEIERSRQAIMDLGLFKSVKAMVDSGSNLVFTIKEKHYFYILPQLHHDNEGGNNFHYGGRLRWDNVMGLNQRIRLNYETNSASEADLGEDTSWRLEYRYPRIINSPYQFDFDVASLDGPLQINLGDGRSGVADRRDLRVRFLLSRWLNRVGPSQGWSLGAGLVGRTRGFQNIQADEGVFEDQSVLGIQFKARYKQVHDHLYSRSGISYGYQTEIGASTINQHRSYGRHQWWLYRYLPVFDQHHNFNWRIELGLSHGTLFDYETAYSIGGSNQLRGYTDLEGDAYVLTSAEYLRPLFGQDELRGLVFIDLGNIYPSNSEMDLSDLRTGAGFGLRWKLKSFVSLDLRADVAYGVEEGEWVVYGGSGATF